MSPTTETPYFFKSVKSENTCVPTITYHSKNLNRKLVNILIIFKAYTTVNSTGTGMGSLSLYFSLTNVFTM